MKYRQDYSKRNHLYSGIASYAVAPVLDHEQQWQNFGATIIPTTTVRSFDALASKDSLFSNNYSHLGISSIAVPSDLDSNHYWQKGGTGVFRKTAISSFDPLTSIDSLFSDNFSHLGIGTIARASVIASEHLPINYVISDKYPHFGISSIAVPSIIDSDHYWQKDSARFLRKTAICAFDPLTSIDSLFSDNFSHLGINSIASAHILNTVQDWDKPIYYSESFKPNNLEVNNCTLHTAHLSDFSLYSKSNLETWNIEEPKLELYRKVDISKKSFEKLICAKASRFSTKPDNIGFNYYGEYEGITINVFFVFNGDIQGHIVNIGDKFYNSYEQI